MNPSNNANHNHSSGGGGGRGGGRFNHQEACGVQKTTGGGRHRPNNKAKAPLVCCLCSRWYNQSSVAVFDELRLHGVSTNLRAEREGLV